MNRRLGRRILSKKERCQTEYNFNNKADEDTYSEIISQDNWIKAMSDSFKFIERLEKVFDVSYTDSGFFEKSHKN